MIEHVPSIVDMRRYLVMEQSRIPATAQAALQNIEQRGHPWRGTQLTRETWMEQLRAEGIDVPDLRWHARSTSTGSAARARSSNATCPSRSPS